MSRVGRDENAKGSSKGSFAYGMWDSSERKDMGSRCSLCSVNQASSMHHLIPVSVSSRNLPEKQCGIKISRMTPLCRHCHSFIHKAFTNEQLAMRYNTVQKLKDNGLVQQFVEIIRGVRNIQFTIRMVQVENNVVIIKPYGAKRPISGMQLRRLKQENRLQELYNLTRGREELRMVDSFFSKQFNSTWNKSRGLLC